MLLTCSMYGRSPTRWWRRRACPCWRRTTRCSRRWPSCGPRRVAVLGPIQAGVDDTVARLRAHLGDDRAEGHGRGRGGRCPGGVRRDLPELERLVTAVARAVERSADVIVLGQFSLSPAAAAVAAALSCPSSARRTWRPTRLHHATRHHATRSHDQTRGGPGGRPCDRLHRRRLHRGDRCRRGSPPRRAAHGAAVRRPDPDRTVPACDAVVAALKSRTIEPGEAVAQSCACSGG